MADVKPVMECSPDDDKWAVRAKIWDHIEAKDLANFPRPVHNRIPNVKDANIAADQAKGLEVFQKAQTVKVNPDKPQEQARFNVLEANKTLLVPTPRLREGLFNKIEPPAGATKEQLRICSMSQGVKEFSSPVGLDSKVKVDLIIIGSVAVSTKGWRIGKGEGYADLEYGMMRCMGAVDENTPVVTTVHDCQVMDLPEELFGPHDVTVDWIVTPTRVIQCQKNSKPAGILWHLIDRQRLKRVPILKVLRTQEREAGKDVRIKNELEKSEATTTEGSEDEHGEDGAGDTRPRRQRYSRMPRRRYNPNPALYVSDFPKTLRVADFKAKVKESCEPLQVVWRGRNGHAFLVFESKEKCEEAKDLLQGLQFEEQEATVEFSESRGPQRQSEGQEHTEESGNESHERGGDGRRRRNRRRPTGGQNNRRRMEASENEEYDTAEDGEDRRDGRSRRPMRKRMEPDHCLFIGSLPRTLRTSEFKTQVRNKEVNPIRVIWRPRNRYALLQFLSIEEAIAARKALEDFAIDGKPLSVQECTGERKPREINDTDEHDERDERPNRSPRNQRVPRGQPRSRDQRPVGNQRRPPPRMDRRPQGESSDQDEGQGDAKQRPMRRRRLRGPFSTVYVGNLPRKLRISDFKSKVRGNDVQPLRVLWRGNQGHAFLQFTEADKADECIKLLQGLTIEERELTVEKSVRRRQVDDGDGPDGAVNHVDGSAGDDSGAE